MKIGHAKTGPGSETNRVGDGSNNGIRLNGRGECLALNSAQIFITDECVRGLRLQDSV